MEDGECVGKIAEIAEIAEIADMVYFDLLMSNKAPSLVYFRRGWMTSGGITVGTVLHLSADTDADPSLDI
ncbi:uncharacterized protein N7487_005572 [Penicillium crustosum]|uniref:uncharacterized protein n=1 Tax=Penicillium crustosum TaxID=36656 RepID=UPI00238E6A3F|nr:uncharacterized protein N7487_005572 [Penicillium crustosum]KAJ5411213.1 hypothetical protein N7487_005572 [Penicillium crustosum]